MNKEKVVDIYKRVSTNRQAQEFSLEGQLEKGLAVARENFGPDFKYKVYSDNQLSGKPS